MKIVKVNENNIHLLVYFLSNLGSSSKSFRYFEKRNISIIQHHLVTLLYLNNKDIPFCYGHLDKENNLVWLGLCVIESQTNKGYGTKMLNYLISEAKKANLNSINLSVDKSNNIAISLYKKFKFIQKSEDNNILYFYLNLLNENK